MEGAARGVEDKKNVKSRHHRGSEWPNVYGWDYFIRRSSNHNTIREDSYQSNMYSCSITMNLNMHPVLK